MKNLTIVQIIRLAGMATWVLYPVGILFAFANRQGPYMALSAQDWLLLASLTLFGVCFWISMQDIPVSSPGLRNYVLLALQLAASLGVAFPVGDAGLVYLLAAEIPLVLKRQQAIKWILIQCAITVPWTWVIFFTGHYEVVGEFRNVPEFVQIGMISVAIIVWQLFAFSVGWFAANETRNRRELAYLNMELLAARLSLEEKSRVEERLRISRELHDVMGHHLVALNLQHELATRTLQDEFKSPILAASRIAKELLSETRKIVSVLRQDPTDDLMKFVATLQSKIPHPVIHCEMLNTFDIPNEIQHAFLRCIQEAVSNAIRHSSAGNIWIKLVRKDSILHLSIRDDGANCINITPGNGITGMRERIEQLGGKLSIATGISSGCQVLIEAQVLESK